MHLQLLDRFYVSKLCMIKLVFFVELCRECTILKIQFQITVSDLRQRIESANLVFSRMHYDFTVHMFT
jgi:hypothetical protein